MNTKQKYITGVALGLLTLFFILAPFRADAKAFGSECEDVVTGGGKSCIVRTRVCKKYFLWIKYKTEPTVIEIDCTHIAQ